MNKIFSVSTVVAGMFLLYSLWAYTASRYIFKNASYENRLAEHGLESYDFSVIGLFRALDLLPVQVIPFQNDSEKNAIHADLGSTYLNMAAEVEKQTSSTYKDLLLKAQEHYQMAADLVPQDIDAAKGLAEAAFLVEKAEGPPGYALPFFERLGKLAPNHVENLYVIAEYYHYQGLGERLSETVSHLVMVYPSEYGQILKAAFYSPALRPAIRSGLETAVREKINLKQACFALGLFLRDAEDFENAVDYYARGLDAGPGRNSVYNYLTLGSLQLTAGDVQGAFATFETALVKNPGADDLVRRIYHAFKSRNMVDDFLNFASRVDKVRVSSASFGIYVARARMEMGLHELARAGLLQVITDKQDAEAFYLLALIGEKLKDWDAMEVYIQKATILDPSNCHYYKVFAKSLTFQGKKVQAAVQKQKSEACRQSKKN